MFYGRFSGIREREPGGVLNILLRACRCARVWTVQKKSGKVKIPAGWDEKYSGRMEFFIGWHEKNPEILPEEGKNGSSAREIHAEKSGFFFWKNSGEAQKISKRAEKFLSFPTKKTWKISGLSGKTCLKTRWQKQKKADFSFEKVPRKQKNYGNRQKIFSAPHKKGRKNYPDEAKKSQKTDDPDEKKQQIFRRRKEKCRKGCEAGQKNLPKHLKKYENTQTKREKIHFRKDGSFWKNRFFIKRIRRKRQRKQELSLVI